MEQTKLEHYLKACVPLIYVRTAEDSRGVKHIMEAVNKANLSDCWIGEWSANKGLVVNGERTERDTISKALNYLISSEDTGVLIIHNIRQFISNFLVIQDLKDSLMVARVRGSYIILIGAEVEFPPEIRDLAVIYDFPLPNKEFFTGIFSEMVEKYKDSMELPPIEEEKIDIIGKAASAALGMNAIQGESAMALSIVKTRNIDLPTIYASKEQAIRQSKTLELIRTVEGIDSLGGFDQFKKWIVKRKDASGQTAIEYGLRPPRGVLLCGIPGCLSEDTLIPISRRRKDGGYRKITIEELWYRFNGKHKEGVEAGCISKAKRIWDESYTTKTLSYKDDLDYIGYNEIEDVVFSGKKPVYRILTEEGRKIDVTLEHRFYTGETNGYVELRNLNIGDNLVCYKLGKLLYDHTYGRRTRQPVVQISKVGNHPNARVRRINKLTYTEHPLHRLVVEANMNSMPLEDFLCVLNNDIKNLKFLDNKMEVHHKDGNRLNNKLSNLEILTKEEHSRLHAMSRKPKLSNYTNRPRAQKIASIEYIGEKNTYDITMKSPHNNFVANGFVVHNCGKSLGAKVISSVSGLPLIRFDIGKVFQSLQGQSEAEVRGALRVAEAVAPAILWIEEIEKSMAGSESSGRTDSGTTARIMQTILTWMQEKESSVFVVATMNRISSIPPELLRKGRFDEIFGVDLPVQTEREEIFSIHIKKRNRISENYDLVKLGEKSEGYTGAEIEAAIDDAMATAFSDGVREFTTEDILNSMSETIPQSSSQREEISAIREWITTRTRLVSSYRSPKWNINAGKELLSETRKVRGQ